MTFWEFLDSVPWWLMWLAGCFVGSFAMYRPALKKGQIGGIPEAPRQRGRTTCLCGEKGPRCGWPIPCGRGRERSPLSTRALVEAEARRSRTRGAR